MRSKLLLIATSIATTLVLGFHLYPGSGQMFDFHDQTLPARIAQFTGELQQGHIPPRIAPDFSFGLGYPVFTFYAPAAFFLTSALDLASFSVPDAIKLSFLLAIGTAFAGMYLFLRRFFDRGAAYLGAFVYVTIPYLAVDIFVRGNLGEVWFFALLPLVLWSMHQVNEVPRRWSIVVTTLLITALITVHNIFSLVCIPLLIIYGLVLQRRWLQMGMIGIAILIGSSFFLPIALETGTTYATEVATKTEYQDHFLCPSQLWDGIWGYGGSVPGCVEDGMSFKLGKLQVILAVFGTLLFLVSFPWRKIPRVTSAEWIFLGSFLIFGGSIFMTLELSRPIWDLFAPVLSLFQFPWRFLLLSMFGMAVMAAYGADRFPPFWSTIPIIVLAIALVVLNQKYFFKPPLSTEEFKQKYLSEEYIATEVAYRIPEYLPRTASYEEWISYWQNDDASQELRTQIESSGIRSSTEVTEPGRYLIQHHASGNWLILVDDSIVTPDEFDELGRPIITIPESATFPVPLTIQYQQTLIQQMGSIISLLSIGGLGLFAYAYTQRMKKETRQGVKNGVQSEIGA